MTGRNFRLAILMAAALLATGQGMAARAQGIGPFTQTQVNAGRIAFLNNCTNCHGITMMGGSSAPALTGPNFSEDWSEKSTRSLFHFASENMPLNAAGTLSQETYINLVSFILAVNGARPGAVPFTRDSDVRIGTIADGHTDYGVLEGQTVPAKAATRKRP